MFIKKKRGNWQSERQSGPAVITIFQMLNDWEDFKL